VTNRKPVLKQYRELLHLLGSPVWHGDSDSGQRQGYISDKTLRERIHELGLPLAGVGDREDKSLRSEISYLATVFPSGNRK
jgi:hypothetical protein